MKIAFIHQDKKIETGAHVINDLISTRLKRLGVQVKHFFPRTHLLDAPRHFKGINNILFFHSLLEHRDEVLKCDLIQGTTYTPLAFLPFKIPVISHFGSTTDGFLKAVPQTVRLDDGGSAFYGGLRAQGVIKELNVKTRKPLRDIAQIEHYVANQADACIATSELVKQELVGAKVPAERVHVIHNAIDDSWFAQEPTPAAEPGIAYLGRMGHDTFTFKLKGLDHLAAVYREFDDVPKRSVVMTSNPKLVEWLQSAFPKHQLWTNLLRTDIQTILRRQKGSVLLNMSRYEGFGLSLVEGMSQGLVPVSLPVGVAPEIIEDGVNGYVVKDAKEAAERVRTILKDDILRQRLAAAAQATADMFRADVMAARMLDLYNQVLMGRKRP